MLGALLLCGAAVVSDAKAESKQLTDYVDPMIGAVGEGHVFPGTALPYSMVKVGPDVGDKSSNSGYYPNGPIHGFSHTHLNGSGGGPKYGNVLVMPGTGHLNINNYSSLRSNESVKVGYYTTDLTQYKVKAELTSTHSCGFHRYTFPKTNDAYILIDASSFLSHGWNTHPEEKQYLVGSEVEIISDRQIQGYTRVRGGWNAGDAYTVFFYAQFDTPSTGAGTWKNGSKFEGILTQNDEGNATKTGAYLRFKTEKGQQIKVKVGISFVSIGKAKANLEQELSHWDFDQTRLNAVAIWESLLSKVQVEGGTEKDKTIFYSSLYRVFLQPNCRTGENAKWDEAPYYDDFFAIWDTYRATHPLISLVNETKQAEIVNGLINIYKYEGYMPDARSGNDNGRTQGGSNCDVLVADAFAKKVAGVDYETGLKSMIKNAEVPPGGDERKQGRGGIADYNSLGYLSVNYERSGSRTVEYAYNDWCLAQVAKGLGKDSIARKYTKRSENWVNLWRPIEDEGFTGFIMPRNADGTWWDGLSLQWDPVLGTNFMKPFTVHSSGSWGEIFYESKSWEYSLYVPHDVNKLIEKCGGKETFSKRLDVFFNKEYFQMWNEPGFLSPNLYNYIGEQPKTAKLVRGLLADQYKTTPDGCPGNDDSGSMAAWYCFHAMGFFPNAGQDLYLISSPIFKKVTITMDNGKQFTITAKNAGEKNIYIKKAKLNGVPLNQSWFRHTDIMNGGTLDFEMSEKPAAWDTGALPPSESK